MAIAFTKYVDITSGVGGSSQAAQRELIGRLFTINNLVPTETSIEFTDIEDVADYFGTTAEEFKRASFYFSFVSKLTTSAQKISFARWADVDTAPQIFGEEKTQLLSNFTSISDGAITLTLGIDTEIITGIDFTTDLSLTDVAATIETAVQAANVAALWTGATVIFDAVNSRFNLTGGVTGAAVVSVADAALPTGTRQPKSPSFKISRGPLGQSVATIGAPQ